MIWALVAAAAFAITALVLGVELVGTRARCDALTQRLERAQRELAAALALLDRRRR